MKNTTPSLLARWLASISFIALLLALALPAQAVSDSWNLTTGNGNWNVGGNWLGGNAPGIAGGTTSPDVATFPLALTAARTVTVDANRNIGTITFSHTTTTAANGYTLATGPLNLTSGGVIEQTAGTHNDTISAGIVIQGDPGTLTIRNTVPGQAAGLVISTTGINGVATAGNTSTLYLDGTSTSSSASGGANNSTPVISDGTGGGKVAVVKDGAGLWTLNLANTFSGGMTLNAGTIRFFGNNIAAAAAGTSGYMLGTATATIYTSTFNHGNGTATSVIRTPLLVKGDITLSGGNNVQWWGTMDFDGGIRTITQNSGTGIVFTNVISNGGLIKAGADALTLIGPNTYTLGTTVSAGTLFVNSPGSLASGAVTVNSTLAGNGSIAGAVTAAFGSTIAPGASAVGTLTLSSDLTLSGGGSLVFEITNTASADKIVVGGNLYSSPTTTISLPNTATLTNADYTLMEVVGTLGGSATDFSVTSPNPLKVYEVVYVAGSPKKVVLRVSDNTSARTWIGGGGNTWNLNTANKVWTNVIFGGPLTNYLDGNVVTFDSLGSVNSSVSIGEAVSPGGIIVSSATDYAFSGAGYIYGSGNLIKSGAGALSVSTANSYSGATAVNGGLVKVGVNDSLGSGTLTMNGGKLGTLASVSLQNPVILAAATEVTNANDLTLSGAVSGSGAFTKSGAGTLVLGYSANTYSGPLTVSDGTLETSYLPTASSVTLGGSGTTGTFHFTGASGTSGKPYTLPAGGTGVIQVEYSPTTLTLSKEISGGGSLIKNGAGGLTLSASNSFSGGLTVNGAPLNINSDYAFGTGTVTLNNTIAFGGGGQTTTNNTIVNGNVTITANYNALGQFSGNGSLTYNASGFTLSLQGENSAFSGPITNQGGTITVKHPRALGTGKLYLNGTTLGGVGGGSAHGATPLTNDIVLLADSNIGNNQALDLAGVISGSFAVNRNGTGKMLWSGASTYTGDTTLNSTGTTLVNGSLASPNVYVGTGANACTFGGAGTISGAVTVNSGATLSPGTNANAAGTLTINNTLTFLSGSTAMMELDKLNGTNDAVKGLSTVSFDGTLTVTSLGGSFASGNSFKLFTAGTYSGNFTATNLPVLPGSLEWVWNPNNGTLSVIPSSLALVWRGSAGAAGSWWDIDTTTNWFSTSGPDTYVDGNAVTFDNTGATNPTVNIKTVVSPLSVTVSSSSNYAFTGSGYISGTGGLLKDGTGTLIVGTANNYTNATTVNGGTLSITGSLTNAGGAIEVNGGKLAVSGSVNLGAGALSAGSVATNGVISINPGAAVTVNAAAIGSTLAGGNGALNVTGGSLTLTNTSSIGGNGGYGALAVSGGAITGTFVQLANGSASTGVGLISGGTLTANDYLIVGRNGTGVLTVGPGGSVNHTAATHAITVAHASGSRGEFNLAGGNVDSTGQNLVFGEGAGTTGTGILNLDAGKLIIDRIISSDGTNRLNFNGGALQAATNTTSFIASTLPVYIHGAFGSFAGGAVVDTAAFNVTNPAAFLAPTGNGVSAISAAGTQGSGYIGAPYVQISGDGAGATGFANMVDDGTGAGTFKVGTVTVSNPGENYTTATVSFLGGAPTSAATGTASLAANTSGGLVKLGAGMLAFTAASTYTGSTIVSNGILSVQNTTGSGTGTGAVTVKSGGVLAANGIISGPVTAESLGGVGGKGFILNSLTVNSLAGLSPGNYDIGTLTVNTLTLAAGSYTFMDIDKTTNTKDVLSAITSIAYAGTLDVANLSGTFTGGESYQLFSAPSYSGNFSAFNLPALDPGLQWVWTPTNGTLAVVANYASTPTNISYAVSGGNLTLTWPASYLGWFVQSNSVSVGSTSSWFDIPGSETVTTLNITINPGQPRVFYRMRKP